jgi:hypothetical protein
VDDDTFFEHARNRIEELGTGDAPWFATLLTVGTHHPYLVPDDFVPSRASGGEPDGFARAIAYSDDAVARFLSTLEARGVLENTLVLVTSDESRGIRAQTDVVSQLISQSWGFLIAAGPGVAPGLVVEPFALSDLPLSVLDVLGRGAEARSAGLIGRSVFRTETKGRFLFFANTRRQSAGAFDPDGRLLLCRRSFQHCEGFVPSGRRLYGETRTPFEWAPDGGGIVGTAARLSLESGAARAVSAPSAVVELMANPRVSLTGARRMLHGGQNVGLAADEWVEVEIDVSVRGGGSVELHHQFWDPFRTYLDETRALEAGRRYRLRYVFAPGRRTGKVQCMTIAKPQLDPSGQPVVLDFDRARMTVHSSNDPPSPGLHVALDEIQAVLR